MFEQATDLRLTIMPAASLSQPSRPSRWEWMQAALLVGNVVWTTLCLGGHRADTRVVTGSLLALSLALHFGRRTFTRSPLRWHPAGWLLVPFLVYAAANVRWVTPVPWLGWQDWLGWAQMIAIFWVGINDLRATASRRFVFLSLVALATVAVALACYQRFARPDWLMLGYTQAEQFLTRSSGPFAIPNSLAALLVLILPAMLLPVLGHGGSAVVRVGFGYLVLLFLLGLGLTVSRGAWLGLAVALVAWPWCAGGRRRRTRFKRTAVVFAALVAISITAYFAVPKIHERLNALAHDVGERSRPVMWRAAGKLFQQDPVLGSGAGSFNPLFEQYRAEHEQKIPRYVHNDYLNTLSDYGAVGFLLFFGATAAIVGRCARPRLPPQGTRTWDWFDTRSFSVALSVGLLAFALHLFVDFHLKTPALALAVALVAALVVVREWPLAELPGGTPAAQFQLPWRRALSAVAVVGVAFVTGFWVIPTCRAEARRADARRSLDSLAGAAAPAPARRSVVVAEALTALSRAVILDPENAQAWADRAYVHAIIAHFEPAREKELGVAVEADARRALALSRVVPDFWLRLGVALDMQHRGREAGEAFAEALRLAPVSASVWFYYAYHLSLNPNTIARARDAVATSLRLDPSAREAETLRQYLAEHR